MCHFTEQMVELLSTQTTDKTQSHFETITNPADHIKKNDRNPLANKRVSLKQTHLKCHSDCFKQSTDMYDVTSFRSCFTFSRLANAFIQRHLQKR